MLEVLNAFHFLRPFWLFALLPILFIMIFSLRAKFRNANWQKHINPAFFAVLSEGHTNKRNLAPIVIIGLAWTIITIALAGPTWTKKAERVEKENSALVVIWDLSPSMNTQDIAPSRLVRSRLKLIDLLNQRNTGLTALIVYGGEAHIVTPLTDDNRTIKALLPSLSPGIMPKAGSNIETAFELSLSTLENAGVQKGNIIIITDGIATDAKSQLIKLNKNKNHAISIWGMGTEEGGPIPLDDGNFARTQSGEIVIANLDDATLSDIASSLNGIYIPFNQGNLDLQTIMNFALDDSHTTNDEVDRFFDKWVEYGPYFLFPVILLFAASFRRGWLVSLIALGFFIEPESSYATKLSAWWLTDDQIAQEHWQKGEHEKAAGLYKDENWRAAAHYKTGDYQAAAEHYSNGNSAADAFNLGNSLAKQGLYEEAIHAYEKTLSMNENYTDAINNKKIIEQLLQNKEKQNNDDAQQGDEGEQKDGQQEDSDNKSQQNQNSEGGEQDQTQSGDESKSDEQESSTDGKNNTANKDQSDNEETKQALDEHYKQQENDKTSEENEQQSESKEDNEEKNAEEVSRNTEQDSEQTSEETQENNQALIEQAHERVSEADQELNQWLRKVPDDPGGLMRNKFAQESQQRRLERPANVLRSAPNQEQRW